MYYPIIRQCIQALKNLETWLDKAEKHAAAKKFDVNTLMTDRLAPDALRRTATEELATLLPMLRRMRASISIRRCHVWGCVYMKVLVV